MDAFDGTDWWDKPWERYRFEDGSWWVISSESDEELAEV